MQLPTNSKTILSNGWRTTRNRPPSASQADPHCHFLDTAPKRSLLPKPATSVRPIAASANGRNSRAKCALHFSNKNDKPSRKKADRENMMEILCSMCAKFYATLASGPGSPIRICDHVQNSSHHHYRTPPPCTPPGFGTLGSQMRNRGSRLDIHF